MPNVIILGHEGVAGPARRRALRVEASFVHQLPKRVDSKALQSHGTKLRVSNGRFNDVQIETIHWIGHGNPMCLFLNSSKNNRASAQEVAAFLDTLNPKQVIFWACNTGLRRVKGATNKTLRRECNAVGAIKDIKSHQFNSEMLESFTCKVAKAMNTTGVDIYGSPVGVGHDISGIYGAFNERTGGAPQLVHWRSENNNHAATYDPTLRKYRQVVVSFGRIFRFICSYEPFKRNTRCKYFGPYEL